VAIIYSLVIFTVQDLWILFAGKPFALHGFRGPGYLLCTIVAALFSAATVSIWRPGAHGIVMALFSVSMASHILEQVVSLPAQELRPVAACRIIVGGAVVFLFLRYRPPLRTPEKLRDP
jgi:hypothetical protein